MTGSAQLGPALQLLRLTTGSLRDHGPRDDVGCRRLAALAVPVPASGLAGVGRAEAALAVPGPALLAALVGWAGRRQAAPVIPFPTLGLADIGRAEAALAVPHPTLLLPAFLGWACRREAAPVIPPPALRLADIGRSQAAFAIPHSALKLANVGWAKAALAIPNPTFLSALGAGLGRRDAASILVALVARFAHALALRVTLFVRPRLAQWRRFRAAPAFGHRLAVGT